MKKVILIAAAILGTATVTLAQGVVQHQTPLQGEARQNATVVRSRGSLPAHPKMSHEPKTTPAAAPAGRQFASQPAAKQSDKVALRSRERASQRSRQLAPQSTKQSVQSMQATDGGNAPAVRSRRASTLTR